MCTGGVVICSQTCKFKALQLQKASVLAQLQPLSTLEQFMFDIFLFHESFAPIQFIGIGYLFALYAVQGVKFIYWDIPKEKARTEKKKDKIVAIIDQEQDDLMN